MTQIICRDLKLGYDGKTIAENLSFEIKNGDYLCIVGENGAGKSTLIKTLLGLEKPLFGEISYANDTNFNEIGYLPQQSQLQRDFPATVWEIALSGAIGRCRKRLFFGQEQKNLAKDCLKKLGIEAIKNKSFRELSGGQQQRVLLARALCAAQKVLILDEPASGLDPRVTGEFYELIKDINKNHGVTIVMVSHDIHSAVKYAKHILHLGDGKMFFGTVEEYESTEISRGFLKGDRGEGHL